jgi:NitT/TauT family transport system permease protein
MNTTSLSNLGKFGYACVSAAVFIFAWWIASALSSPHFMPSPWATAVAMWKLTISGVLIESIGVSYFRILSGWLIGAIVAVPAALFAGRIPILRHLLEPFFNFFRFVPPIAFLGVAILWFGIGEQSKVALIIYTSLFTVFMSTMAGVTSLDQSPERAALSLGASRQQVLWHVVLPGTIPTIIVGMRIGMGFSFMSVVAAEMIAAQEGVGFLIFNARLLFKTANAFAGIITLGIMGLLADWVFRRLVRTFFHKHSLPF